MKQTKIVATIGPASETPEILEALARAGANVFRLNFSHGDHSWFKTIIERIRAMNEKNGFNVAILLDTKGPEIRTGELEETVYVKAGDELILSIDPGDYAETGKVGVNYDAFIGDVEVGERILVDSGVINLTVKAKTAKDVICEVHDEGEITSRRHLNIPMKEVSLDSITEKDWADIDFGIEMKVDFIALSFVRNAEDVTELRAYLKKHNSNIAIIPKVESYQATQHLPSIVKEADGIMVARGDLGAEVPFSHVPRIQHELIELASQFRKPVIVATHMLESMIENPMPTRAEVSDVNNAVWQGTDAVMLSGESAAGEYPVKSVETMAEIAKQTEIDFVQDKGLRQIEITSPREEFALLAARVTEDLDEVKAIFVMTRTGKGARLISAFRPKVPIFAFTDSKEVQNQLQLVWGVTPYHIEFSDTPEETVQRAKQRFLKNDLEWKGTSIVLASDTLNEARESIPTIQLRTL